MKKVLYGFLVFILVISLSSCASSGYEDGIYTGESNDEESGSSMQVEVSIESGKITACAMKAYDKEGNIKDENYGKSAGGALYEKAQRAVKGMAEYPEMLVKVGNPDDVDAVAGATVSNKEFKIAVKAALEKAE